MLWPIIFFENQANVIIADFNFIGQTLIVHFELLKIPGQQDIAGQIFVTLELS